MADCSMWYLLRTDCQGEGMMEEDYLKATDYLTETLKTEKHTQIEIFEQMLNRLEDAGKCRYVYHRLGRVLFDIDFDNH